MTATLPPLGLDDIRCTAPDRDCEQRFYAEDTLQVAREKVAIGYPAAVVADVLLQLDPAELAGVLAEALEEAAKLREAAKAARRAWDSKSPGAWHELTAYLRAVGE
jgi:hypothetical protein